MAGRTNKVEIEIVATDEATPKIERLERKIDGLESDEARIVVKADTDRLEKQLANAKAKLDGLDGDEASVQLRAVGTLEADLDHAETLLRQLDGKTGTVKLTAVDNASKKLDAVRSEMRTMDGDTVDIKIDAKDSTGTSFGSGGVAAGLGLAAIPALAVAGSTAYADMAFQAKAVADSTGSTMEDASALIGVWQNNGQETGDLRDILSNVNQVLRDNPDLAAQLGIKIDENTSLVDLFIQAVDNVGPSFDNASDRANAMALLFGEEGKRQVEDVTARIDGPLSDAIEDVPKAQIMDEEDLERAKQINDELIKMKGHWRELQLAAAEGLIPWVNKSIEEPFSWGSFLNTALMANPVTAPLAAFLAGGGLKATTSPREQQVIQENTTGFFGGAFGAIRAPVGTTAHVPQVTVINPPHVQTTVDSLGLWDRRNGGR